MTVSKANIDALSREEAIQRLQNQTVSLRYEGCTEFHYASANYEFDFSAHEWRREMVYLYGAKDTGPISTDIEERFFDMVWSVANLTEKIYCTDTERLVPGSAEKRSLHPDKVRCLSKFRAELFGKIFCWIIETDTDNPYCLLASAFQSLLAELDI